MSFLARGQEARGTRKTVALASPLSLVSFLSFRESRGGRGVRSTLSDSVPLCSIYRNQSAHGRNTHLLIIEMCSIITSVSDIPGQITEPLNTRSRRSVHCTVYKAGRLVVLVREARALTQFFLNFLRKCTSVCISCFISIFKKCIVRE